MINKELKLELSIDNKKAKKAVTSTSKSVKDLAGSSSKLNKSTKNATKLNDKFNKSLKKQQGIIGNNGKGLVGAVGGLKTGLIALGTAGFAGAIIAGAKFEREMATVSGIMRASTNDIEKMTEAAIMMGAASEHGANKAAQALKYMAMAGYTADEAIEALPGILDLASASGLDLAAVSDIVTDSLTAMGMEVDELSRFNDVLTGVTSRSNTNILMLGESLKYVAPVAAQMGYEIEELSAMLGILANAGIKSSDAGTDLRQAMIKNVKVSKQFGKAEGDLVGTLKEAKKAGWGVTEVVKAYGLIAAKSVLVLMSQIDAYDELAEEMQNVEGETQKIADLKLDTAIGQWNSLKAVISGIGIELENSTGFLQDFLQDLKYGVQAIKLMSQGKISFADSMFPKKAVDDYFLSIIDGAEKVNQKIRFDERELRGLKEKISSTGAPRGSVIYNKIKELKNEIKMNKALLKFMNEEGGKPLTDKDRKDKAKAEKLLADQKEVDRISFQKKQLDDLNLLTKTKFDKQREIAQRQFDNIIDNEYADKQVADQIFQFKLNAIQKLQDAEVKSNAFKAKAKAEAAAKAKADAEVYYHADKEIINEINKVNELEILLANTRTSNYDQWVLETNDMKSNLLDLSLVATESFANGITDGLWDFIDGTKSANEALKDFARSYARELGSMITKTLMLASIQKIVGMIGGGGGESVGGESGGGISGQTTTGMFSAPLVTADGNAFNNGKVTPFASGGIVNSPTLFPMADGMGLMGEAGAEAVMPLKRTSEGKLGVENSGGTSSNISININAVDVASFSKMLKRNPEAIVEIIDESLRDRSGLLNTMRGTI